MAGDPSSKYAAIVTPVFVCSQPTHLGERLHLSRLFANGIPCVMFGYLSEGDAKAGREHIQAALDW
jgi:hypothetical protein